MRVEQKDLTFILDDTEYEASVIIEYYDESNYGADIDGNRGVPMTFIEDIKIEEIRELKTSKRVQITNKMKRKIDFIACEEM